MVLALSLALPLSGHAAGSGGRDRAGSPTRAAKLWHAFPLHETPTAPLIPPRTPTPSTVAVGSAPQAIVISPRSDGIGLPLLAAGLLALVTVTGGLVFLTVRGPASRWRRALDAVRRVGSSSSGPSYVLVLPGRLGRGQKVLERTGTPPELGEVIFDRELGREGQGFVVELVGPSPLPGDGRPCAFLLPL